MLALLANKIILRLSSVLADIKEDESCLFKTKHEDFLQSCSFEKFVSLIGCMQVSLCVSLASREH